MQPDSSIYKSIKTSIILTFTVFSFLLYEVKGQEVSGIIHTETKDSHYVNQLIYSLGELSNDSAIIVANEALILSNKLKYVRGQINANNVIGRLKVRMGSIAESIHYFKNVIDIIDQNPAFKEDYAINYNNIAQSYSYTGSTDSAMHYFQKSLRFQEQYGTNDYYSTPYMNYARFLNIHGYKKESLRYFNHSLEIAKEKKEYKLLAGIHQNLGIYYINSDDTNKFEKAEQYLREALNISTVHLLQHEKRHTYIALGILHQNKMNNDSAVLFLEKALQTTIYDAVGDIGIYYRLGEIYYNQKNYKKAESYLFKGIDKTEGRNVRLLEYYALLAKIYQEVNQPHHANQYYAKYVALIDSMDYTKMAEKISNVQFQYETAQKDKEISDKQLQIVQQHAIIQRKNTITFIIIAGMVTVAAFTFLILFNRRRNQKQQEQQALEMASWQASMEGEERERRRLAHQLHDGIAGNLSTLSMWLENIQKQEKYTLQEYDFSDAMNLLDQTLTEVRNTAHHLMPELLLRFGLAEALRIFCSNIQKASNMDIRYHYFGFIGNMSKSHELVIYRSVQELVQNMVKHSGATQALVQLSRHENILNITVEDNGKGFIINDTFNEERGMGLTNIQNSIEKMKGKFNIISEPDSGTTIEIEIEINDDVTDMRTSK